MPIRVLCACGKAYQVRDEHAGRQIQCKACGEVVKVPDFEADDGLVTLPVCPACQAVLEPDADRCDACGHLLAPAAEAPPEPPELPEPPAVPPALLTREVPVSQPAVAVQFDGRTVMLVVLAGVVVAAAIGGYFALTTPDPPPVMGKPEPIPEAAMSEARPDTPGTDRADLLAHYRPTRVGVAPPKAATSPAPGAGGGPATRPDPATSEDPADSDWIYIRSLEENKRVWARLRGLKVYELTPADLAYVRWNWMVGSGQGRPRSSYLSRRRPFRTKLLVRGPAPGTPPRKLDAPPGLEDATYQSDSRTLHAWVAKSLPARQGKRCPAVVYLHSGFGLYHGAAKVCRPFVKAGFVVMLPTLRGENGNEGHFELFLGEVDDAKAAVRWLARQPYVDPKHVYAFGHDVGAGLSALLSLHDDLPLRHSGGAGGLFSPVMFFLPWADITPFDTSCVPELSLRVLLGNIDQMKHHHRMYIGRENPLQMMLLHEARMELPPARSRLAIVPLDGTTTTCLPEAVRRYLKLMQTDLLAGRPGRRRARQPSRASR